MPPLLLESETQPSHISPKWRISKGRSAKTMNETSLNNPIPIVIHKQTIYFCYS